MRSIPKRFQTIEPDIIIRISSIKYFNIERAKVVPSDLYSITQILNIVSKALSDAVFEERKLKEIINSIPKKKINSIKECFNAY